MSDRTNLNDLLTYLPEGYAILDVKKLEDDLLASFGVAGNRFPSTDEINRRFALEEFVKLTEKYIISSNPENTAKLTRKG